jgi:hypothetical protein
MLVDPQTGHSPIDLKIPSNGEEAVSQRKMNVMARQQMMYEVEQRARVYTHTHTYVLFESQIYCVLGTLLFAKKQKQKLKGRSFVRVYICVYLCQAFCKY